jgi:ketosteroid isomerase-like protein
MNTTEIRRLDTELNEMITRGSAIEAFERFYADDIVMQENLDPPTRGKQANREREEKFFGNIETLHTGRVVQSAVGDDVSFAEMEFDATMQGGERVHMTEVARRQWKDGKIVHERFYYAPADTSLRAALKRHWPQAMQDLHEMKDRLELEIHLGGKEVESGWAELQPKIDRLAQRFADKTETKLDALEASARELLQKARSIEKDIAS